MKFVTFQVGKTVSYGAVSGDGIIDLGKRLGKKYPTLRSALKAGKLNELKTVAKSARKTDVATSPRHSRHTHDVGSTNSRITAMCSMPAAALSDIRAGDGNVSASNVLVSNTAPLSKRMERKGPLMVTLAA